MANRILIVDDEESIVDSLSLILRHAGYEVDFCYDGIAALKKFSDSSYDLILLDIKMPKMDGMEVLEKMMDMKNDQLIIMISGHGNIETAVEATKKGAYYFLEKPLPDISEMLVTFKNAIDYKNSKDELARYKKDLIESNRIIGTSTKILNVVELIEKYKDLNLNLLITGESGTGKLLVANQIHYNSGRSDKPMVVINCANIKESNVDEELFGLAEDGEIKRKGKLEEAFGGTILFDEISNMNLDVQSKLLKVIDEGKFSRIGGTNDIITNVRFLFTTNKDLQSEISEGKFREDLYHRINVMNINIPPLRERVEDISDLTTFFVFHVCVAYNISVKVFNENALSRMKTFRWPGNVRELKNFIERIIFTVDREQISVEDIELPETKHTKELNDLLNKFLSLNEFQNESEKMFLLKILQDYKYNISQTAEALKIQRSHLYKLMSKYDIPTPSRIK
ncbi:MAG: sigma-54 dependent transcriptional regulator [Ignavibacteriota bacterium]|nr:sigma-54 dependent transcriptional regulator [Ignavibacteriota bacterium]